MMFAICKSYIGFAWLHKTLKTESRGIGTLIPVPLSIQS